MGKRVWREGWSGREKVREIAEKVFENLQREGWRRLLERIQREGWEETGRCTEKFEGHTGRRLNWIHGGEGWKGIIERRLETIVSDGWRGYSLEG